MKRDEIIQYLRRFKELNKDRYHIVRLGVFGSVARDSMAESSDIDVVVELAYAGVSLLLLHDPLLLKSPALSEVTHYDWRDK